MENITISHHNTHSGKGKLKIKVNDDTALFRDPPEYKSGVRWSTLNKQGYNLHFITPLNWIYFHKKLVGFNLQFDPFYNLLSPSKWTSWPLFNCESSSSTSYQINLSVCPFVRATFEILLLIGLAAWHIHDTVMTHSWWIQHDPGWIQDDPGWIQDDPGWIQDDPGWIQDE